VKYTALRHTTVVTVSFSYFNSDPIIHRKRGPYRYALASCTAVNLKIGYKKALPALFRLSTHPHIQTPRHPLNYHTSIKLLKLVHQTLNNEAPVVRRMRWNRLGVRQRPMEDLRVLRRIGECLRAQSLKEQPCAEII
jgi:hypothetical protein